MSALIAARRRTKPCYIIDPRQSKLMSGWDLLTSLCLIFTALITPYEVSFLRMPSTLDDAWQSPLFVTNRLIDVIFIVDLVLNFLLMVQDHTVDGTKWIDEPAAIAKAYLRSWFLLDLASILASAFDLIPYALMESSEGSSGDDADADKRQKDFLKRFMFLRIVRCFRLIKLMRLLRASRVMARWETRINIHYGYLSLWKVLAAYILVAHWSGCLLVLPTTFYDNIAETWLGHYGYCVASLADGSGGNASEPDECYRVLNERRGLHTDHALNAQLLDDGTCVVVCEEPFKLFVASVYLTLQVICGATGGAIYRDAFNTQEQALFMVLCALGALLWGQVIGTFVSVIANAHPESMWFRSRMDQLNQFMSIYGLAPEMRQRLREYFQQSRHVQRGQQRKRVLEWMSPLLKGEVALAINRRWLQKIRFLKGAETELVVLVACSLQPAVFTPGELATPGFLYVIHKGIAFYTGRLLTSGKCWGQDMILARQHLCRFTARAMSYLEVYRISRSELLHLARPFPIAVRRIRWEALRLAIVRTLVQTKNVLAREAALREAAPRAAAAPAPSASGEAGGEEGAEGGGGIDGLPAGRVWKVFLQQAGEVTATQEESLLTPKVGLDDPATDPDAVHETPSLHDLSRGLTQVRSEVAELRQGIGEILRRTPKPPDDDARKSSDALDTLSAAFGANWQQQMWQQQQRQARQQVHLWA